MKNKKWFSFVELIVSVTILAIISTIWFISYSSYLWDSRDAQRQSDLSQIWSALKVYKQKRWYYPSPWESSELTYAWTIVAYQGLFNDQVRLNTIDRLALDPKINMPYFYSVTKTKQEFEMAATLENEDNPIALVNGTYKSVSRNILPSIILAKKLEASETNRVINITDWDTDGDINRTKFIFNNQDHNLAYDFIEPYDPKSDATDFGAIIIELEETNSFWQNTDYRNCIEIEESGKALLKNGTILEYQIITNTWALTNTWCTFN